jgi:hypothetical protein
MNNLSKLSIGAVAASAIAAPSTAATTITVDFNLANNGSGFYDITLGGNATPQYQYLTLTMFKNEAYFTAMGTSGIGSQALSYTSNPDFPALGVALFRPTVNLGTDEDFPGNRYLPLQFDINGTTTVGNAFFNNTNDLVKIDYAAVAGGVPEPAIWAELVAGFALAGAAMRRRRPQAVAA